MEITNDLKARILTSIKSDRENFNSDVKHAVALGVNNSVYSLLKKGKTDRLISEANWICIARRLGVALREEREWIPARTATFVFITEQLEMCQRESTSALLCDMPNIGKTFTAEIYVKSHKNAIYIDCSQVKTKQRLIRKVAKEFGINSTGRYYDVYDDLCNYIRVIDNPFIILDEVGDLTYEAFLELKGLWNATARCCGWYMMGANGLQAKITRSIDCEKVGYAEMFSRFDDQYKKILPDEEKERKEFLLVQTIEVAQLNLPEGAPVMEIVKRSGGSLRRLYTEISKLN